MFSKEELKKVNRQAKRDKNNKSGKEGTLKLVHKASRWILAPFDVFVDKTRSLRSGGRSPSCQASGWH